MKKKEKRVVLVFPLQWSELANKNPTIFDVVKGEHDA